MRARTRLAVCAGLPLAVLLSGCGSGDGGDDDGDGSAKKSDGGSPSASASADGRPRVDAPVAFAADKSVPLPDSAYAGKGAAGGPPPVAADRGVLFIARPDGMDIVNGYRHSDPVRITPEHAPLVSLDESVVSSNPAEAPLITSTGGKRLALNAVAAETKGSGTTAGRTVIELMAVDTGKGEKLWAVQLGLGPKSTTSSVQGPVQVVGRSKDIVVVHGLDGMFGVDLKTRKKVWTAEGDVKDAVFINDSTVAAVRDSSAGQGKVVGIDPATGKQRWASPRDSLESAVHPGGPDTVVAREYDEKANEDRNALLDASTGKLVAALPDTTDHAPACTDDGKGTLVCWAEDWVGAFEGRTGKKLWALPTGDGARVAPRVTLVRAGLVYGTTENGPVVLTASTGADKETKPGIAPSVTDGTVGVQVSRDDGTVTSHPVVK